MPCNDGARYLGYRERNIWVVTYCHGYEIYENGVAAVFDDESEAKRFISEQPDSGDFNCDQFPYNPTKKDDE